jgi:hypothetical protein
MKEQEAGKNKAHYPCALHPTMTPREDAANLYLKVPLASLGEREQRT